MKGIIKYFRGKLYFASLLIAIVAFSILFPIESVHSQQHVNPSADLIMFTYGDLLRSDTSNTWCCVVIHIRRTNNVAWSMGNSSFVFNFNYNAMYYPAESTEGRWDNDESPLYEDQVVSGYDSGRTQSIEIRLVNSPSSGVAVPLTEAHVGAICYKTNQWNAFHNVTWSSRSVIRDNTGRDITSYMNFISPPNGFVPVDMETFSSVVLKNDVTLHWSTSNEINNSGFLIERMKIDIENSVWNEAGFIIGNGSVFSSSRYEFTDRNLSCGKYNYRLKQIDYNGNFRYYELESEIEIVKPDKFSLNQNFPNPFNPSTVITFELPHADDVELTVIDISGRKMLTLLNNFIEAGYHTVNLNASSMSSGIYIYRLRTSFIDVSKKMIVRK